MNFLQLILMCSLICWLGTAKAIVPACGLRAFPETAIAHDHVPHDNAVALDGVSSKPLQLIIGTRYVSQVYVVGIIQIYRS